MDDFFIDVAEKFIEEMAVKTLASARLCYPTDDFDPKASAVPGVHARRPSSNLMKLLYATHVFRPDLTVAIELQEA